MRGQGGGRETGDLCPSVTHAALGLMLMENEMFKSLAEKIQLSLNPLLVNQCNSIITIVQHDNAVNDSNMSHFQ